MKMTKRWLSLFLSLIMVVGLFTVAPVEVSAASVEVAEVGEPSQTDAIAWLNAQVGKSLDYDGAYGAQCVDLIKYYYDFFGYASYARGNGCDYATNTLPPSWTRIQGGAPQIGDILVWTGGPSGYGHVAIYGGNNQYFHQNWNGQYVKILTKSYTSGFSCSDGSFCSYWGVIRPQFGTHITHSYDTYVYYWKSHPHYKCYKCSCGEVKENRDEPTYIDSCEQCRVGKTTVYSDKDVYCPGERIELSWDAASNATHYNFYIKKKESNGEYNGWIDFLREYKQTSYSIHGLPVGDYMISLYSYDSKHWESDGSDWCHEMAEPIYFSVKEYKATPVATTTFNNNTYEIYNISMPWTEAKAYCEYLGGHLVTITSQGEQNAIRDLVSQGERYCYWMGMTDEDDEGNWVNITGEPITFSNWIAEEPNNQNGDEHYGVVRNLDGNNWNDVTNLYASNSIGFICEYEKQVDNISGFDVKSGETFLIEWSEVADAEYYEVIVYREEETITISVKDNTKVAWNPVAFEGDTVYLQVMAYNESGELVGKSNRECYEIQVICADWWGICGDSDLSDKITVKDATYIQKYTADLVTFSEIEKTVADVNHDLWVNVKDATIIQKYVAGIETDSYAGERIHRGWTEYIAAKKDNVESDWVLAAQVPDGAEITQRKWTYDKTETTTSTNSSMSGWTLTESSWEQTGSGTHKYASYPGGFSTTNSLYYKYAKGAISSSETETTKRTVSDASTLTYIYWHWCRGDDSLGTQYNRRINEVYTSEFNTFDAFESTTAVSYDSAAEAYKYVNKSCCGDSYWWMRTTVYSQTYTDYQKIYSFSKTTEIESDAYPTEESISNVQEWVKYYY